MRGSSSGYDSPPMRALRVPIAAAVLVAASCGPTKQSAAIIPPTGGDVCLTDDKVCISIPSGALEQAVSIRILPTDEVPGGSIGPGYEIGPRGTVFLKPAKVVFKIGELFDEDAADAGVNPLLLRLYTKYQGDWQPLATPAPPLDRVRRTLTGYVDHLSPFVILRADRLPDGTEPVESDGGKKDAGVIVVPPFDAGKKDGG